MSGIFKITGGDSGQKCNFRGEMALRIYERVECADNLISLNAEDRDFDDTVVERPHAGCFNVYESNLIRQHDMK